VLVICSISFVSSRVALGVTTLDVVSTAASRGCHCSMTDEKEKKLLSNLESIPILSISDFNRQTLLGRNVASHYPTSSINSSNSKSLQNLITFALIPQL
jgi:hypothetical protein